MGQISGAMGDVFGKMAPPQGGGAANTAADVAANNGGSGLTGGQLFARKALAGGLGGLGKGLGQPQPVRQGMAPPINVPQAPLVDPAMFGASGSMGMGGMGKRNNFYGQ